MADLSNLARGRSPLRVLELRTVRGTGGGPEKTILLGTARTDARNYAITVCYIRDDRDPIFHIDRRAQDLALDYVELRERHSFDHRLWPQLTRLVDDRHIEIVHSHDYKTNLLAWLLSRRTPPVVPLATSHGWTGHTARERLLYYPGDRRILRRFPHVIAVSSDIRDTLIRSGSHPDRVSVILNGIDPTTFTRRQHSGLDVRRELGFDSAHVVIGSVGRLEPQKDFAGLIDVFGSLTPEFPQIRLVIAGDGSLRTALEQQIQARRLSASCRMLGHVDDVRDLHSGLDLFVQSSVYEGTPNAVLEAMAMQTPIVATAAGGTAELARDGLEALIVAPGDQAALKTAIITVLEDREGARLRVDAARRRVETELSFDTRLRSVERIYDRLAAQLLPDRGVGGQTSCETR